ncbi:MAG TPA: sigma-54 dependent transcriptional regulator [Gemmatimonadota bacterium]|nr:sigma-54 dependent transcriptional regulator [Gemmatimonadota bacterium]
MNERIHVVVYGPAAEYLDLIPGEDRVECFFVRPEAVPGEDGVTATPMFVLLDIDYVGGGLERVLRGLSALDSRPRIAAVTREPTADSAVRALTGGATDYFALPRDRERVVAAIAEVVGEAAPARESRLQTLPGFPDIVARCEAMREVLDVVRKVIDSGASTVLIRGDTGTGKELIARAVHYQSTRHDQPFIEVNCTAIPETLLEAELFGYEAGAFTDARTAKAGLLQLAHGGTLFLDELGDMSLALQGKLLRAIETKRFRRLGGTKEIEVVMHIIAATSKNLEEAIAQGLFRSDLYYRLNVVAVELPPLRERADDVLILADHFARRYAEQYRKPPRALTGEAREFLRGYPWPGNVRELKNTIERAVLLGEGAEIGLEDLSPAVRLRRQSGGGGERLVIDLPSGGVAFDEYERRIVAHVLERNGWNRSQTARELGISRPRLLRKIEKYELEEPAAP